MSSHLTTVRRNVEASVRFKRQLLEDGRPEMIARIAVRLVESFKSGGQLLLFGNGGSAADAQHIAAELVGRYRRERRSLPAIALGTNTSSLTAIGNDFGFDEVFSRQVEGLGRPGDVAFGISTSGNSENVVRGIEAARRGGLGTVVLTGAPGNRLEALADFCLAVPTTDTPHVQESHILVAHIICEIVEAELFPDASSSSRRGFD